MIIKIGIRELKLLAVFIVLAAISGSLVYIYFNYFAPTFQWKYKEVTFSFRANLRDAAKAPMTISNCSQIQSDFNSIHVQNVTMYVKNDAEDISLSTLEAVQFTTNLKTYYLANPPVPYEVGIVGALWNLEEDPIGTAYHPRIYFVGPTSAKEFSVSFNDYVLKIQGRNLREMDLATTKAMMCLFGVDLPTLL